MNKYTALLIGVLTCIGLIKHAQSQENIPLLKLDSTFAKKDGKPLEQLLGLTWHNDRLKLRRDWGMPNVEAEHLVEGAARWRMPTSPFHHEVNEVFAALGCGSRGRSGAGDRMQMTGSGASHSCVVSVKDGNYRFTIWQLEEPNHQFCFEERKNGVLRFLLTHDDGLAQVVQNSDGKIAISFIHDDKVVGYSAENFRELYRNQPQVVDNVFLPLVDYVGIGRPLTRDSPEVREFVTRQLVDRYSNKLDDRLMKNVEQLTAKKYADRSRATETIRAKYDEWKGELAKLGDDDSLPLEARTRIKTIINESEVRTSRQKSLVNFVEENDLLNKQSYLFSLVEKDPDLLDYVVKALSQKSSMSEAEIRQTYLQSKKENN